MTATSCRFIVAAVTVAVAVAVVWSMSPISAAYTRHKGCLGSDCRLNFLAVFLALASCCCQLQVAVVVVTVVAAAVVSALPRFVCDFSLEANDHPA